MNAEFFALAFSTVLNPKVLGIDLLLIANSRPRMMFLCFLLGGMGTSVTVGLLDVLVLRVDGVNSQRSVSAGIDLAVGLVLIAVGWLVATGRIRRRQPVAVGADAGPAAKKEGWAERNLREPRPGDGAAASRHERVAREPCPPADRRGGYGRRRLYGDHWPGTPGLSHHRGSAGRLARRRRPGAC